MKRILLFVSLFTVLAGGAAAWAAIPDGRVIHACVSDDEKTLRMIDDASEVGPEGETALSGNTRGRAGATGPAGPAGRAGATGPAGPAAGAALADPYGGSWALLLDGVLAGPVAS